MVRKLPFELKAFVAASDIKRDMISDFYKVKIPEKSSEEELVKLFAAIKRNRKCNGVTLVVKNECQVLVMTMKYLIYLDIQAINIETQLINASKILTMCKHFLGNRITHLTIDILGPFIKKDLNCFEEIAVFCKKNGIQIIVKYAINQEDRNSNKAFLRFMNKYSDVWIQYINVVGKPINIDNLFLLCIVSLKKRILFSIENIPPCIVKDYKEMCEFKYMLNSQYDSETNCLEFTRPIIDDSFIKKEVCGLCKYNYVCQGVPKNIKKEPEPFLIKQNSSSVKTQNVINEKVKAYLIKEQIDAVILFSGGLDSKVSTKLYLDKNPNEKVVLLSFINNKVLDSYRLEWIGTKLKEENTNIICHIVIDLPEEIYLDYIFTPEKMSLAEKCDSNLGCILCKTVMVNIASYISRDLLSCTRLVMGNNQVMANGKMNPPFPQSKEMLEIYTEIAHCYGVNLENIIYYVENRNEVISLGKKYDISPCSDATSVRCPLGMPRKMSKGTDIIMKVLKDEIINIKKMTENDTNAEAHNIG